MRAALVAGLVLTTALAARAEFSDGDPPGVDLLELKHQLEAGQAAEAERALRQALAEEPGDADILNMLGYANRKLDRPLVARDFYNRALERAPAHRGALEYMGELELETGNPDAARALLARLSAACPQGCEELDDLREAFAEAGVALTPN